MRKLLFFDLDGTLVDESTFEVTPSALEAMHKAKRKGNLLFINTGRPLAQVEDKLRNNPVFDGILCGLGTNIWFEGEELHHQALSKSEALRIMHLVEDLEIEVVLEGKERVYIKEHYENEEFELYRSYYVKRGISNALYPCANPQFDKLCVSRKDAEKCHAFLREMQDYQVIDRGPYFYEITPKGYSKATAIDYMCKRLNCSLENCYVFGDSMNDLAMLEHVKHSIVMGNGNPALFSICEYVTSAIDEDGIAKALEHYGLV